MNLLQINAENTINMENVKTFTHDERGFTIEFIGERIPMTYKDDGSVDFNKRYFLNYLNGFVPFKGLNDPIIYLRKNLIKSLSSKSDGKEVRVLFDDTGYTFEMNYKDLMEKLTDTRL